ncbi:MAG TPA: toll/interleukin-1 receptor domain-containing protein [Phototrophicaceae bacterium]|nr:toll/interleukin-1 receptor domain-containing protein [Phototrophicaceae bacterium]
MSDDERFQAWLDKVCARLMPQNAMARIRTLAKELAEGASEEYWKNSIFAPYTPSNSSYTESRFTPKDEFVREYLKHRWADEYPRLELLESNGYAQREDRANFVLIKDAFQLIKEIEPANIFISYKRSESSALALLILKCLKAEGLEAFLDLALEAGENFHAGLKERVQKSDYLVLLLGKQTLKSDYVLREIQWAHEVGISIIPVWHNKFKYKSEKWQLPSEIDQKLANTHAIEVKEESALGYDTAITELLNRFGITP